MAACEECEKEVGATEAEFCRAFIEALDGETKARYHAIYPGTEVVCVDCLAGQFSYVAVA